MQYDTNAYENARWLTLRYGSCPLETGHILLCSESRRALIHPALVPDPHIIVHWLELYICKLQ